VSWTSKQVRGTWTLEAVAAIPPSGQTSHYGTTFDASCRPHHGGPTHVFAQCTMEL